MEVAGWPRFEIRRVAMEDAANAVRSDSANVVTPVRLVPNVLDRLFSYVNPADNVNCHVTHYLIRSIACFQLHNRLAVPKNGVFLLKWPLCFHNREDSSPRSHQFRYTDLLRHNVSLSKLSPAEIIDQVQVFLTGYEAMMLTEVRAAALHSHYYNNLTTFMVDFSLVNDHVRCKEQTLPFESRYGPPLQGRDSSGPVMLKKLFLGNWQLWVRTIIAITDSCAASLSHLLFIVDNFAESHFFKREALRTKNMFYLPCRFYQALNFDLMLSEMRNLQTLYMPVEDYEKAFDNNMPKENIWQLVRKVPQAQFLPLLRRRYVQRGSYLFDVVSKQNNVPVQFSGRLAHLPHTTALDSHIKLCQSKLFIAPTVTSIRENYNMSYVHEASDVLTARKNANTFASQVSWFVNSAKATRERQQRLSVWGDKTRKAEIVLKITDFDDHDESSANHRSNEFKSLAIILNMLHTREVCPSAVRILIEKSEQTLLHPQQINFSWSCMRQLLPFFVPGMVEDVVWRSFRLRMVMDDTFTTFSKLVNQWHVEFVRIREDHEENELFKQQHKLPAIHLRMNKTIEINGNLDDSPAKWVESIEQAIIQKIRVFVCDAVGSFMRRPHRGLSSYLYRSLKRVDYEFDIVCWDDWGSWRTHSTLQEQIQLLWQSRAAKFDQLVAREIFADVLNNANDLFLFSCSIHATITTRRRHYVYPRFCVDEKRTRMTSLELEWERKCNRFDSFSEDYDSNFAEWVGSYGNYCEDIGMDIQQFNWYGVDDNDQGERDELDYDRSFSEEFDYDRDFFLSEFVNFVKDEQEILTCFDYLNDCN